MTGIGQVMMIFNSLGSFAAGNLRKDMFDALMALLATVISGGVGLFAPSEVIQNCTDSRILRYTFL